jgi:YHS domain-containing protein
MENEVFDQPGIGRAIEANYVPVHLNYDYAKETAKQYGVTMLPTTVIIAPTPQGEIVDMITGRFDAANYVARLNRISADARQRALGLVQVPSPPPMAAPATAAPPTAPPLVASGPTMQPPSAPPIRPVAAQAPAAPPAAPAATKPSATKTAAAGAFALDGYCPVQLTEKKVWTRGDTRWGAIHQGQTYLFAGPEEQRRFFADPDRFAPVNAGNDIVLAVEKKQTTPGVRKHGVYYGGRVYLFAGEASVKKFSANPRYYVEQLSSTARAEVATDQRR